MAFKIALLLCLTTTVLAGYVTQPKETCRIVTFHRKIIKKINFHGYQQKCIAELIDRRCEGSCLNHNYYHNSYGNLGGYGKFGFGGYRYNDGNYGGRLRGHLRGYGFGGLGYGRGRGYGSRSGNGYLGYGIFARHGGYGKYGNYGLGKGYHKNHCCRATSLIPVTQLAHFDCGKYGLKRVKWTDDQPQWCACSYW